MSQEEPSNTSVLTTLFAHNTWANLKLVDFCRGLSDEQLDTSAVGGFGSIRYTLRHIVRSEISYVERVNGRLPARPVSKDSSVDFDVLQDAVRWAGSELLQLALSAREDSRVQQHSPQYNAEYPLASLIVQAINHSTEHRTQISTIITQLGMEPPDMSGWKYMEEMGEIRELGKGEEATL